MSAAEWLAALGAVPQRRRGDRWRGFSCRQRIGHALGGAPPGAKKRSRAKPGSPAIRRLPRASDRASRRASAQRPRRPRLRAKRKNPVPSRSAPSVPRADPISWRAAEAYSREAPKRCSVWSRIAPSSRGRAAVPSRRSAVAALLPETNLRRPEQRRRAHPDPRSVRGRRLDRCRCCAPARHSTSCGLAAWRGADCVVTFRRAEAGSLLASRKTPRTCHLIVPRACRRTQVASRSFSKSLRYR